MGLFLANVIIPSQCPKFFSKERYEKLAAALSEVSSTYKSIGFINKRISFMKEFLNFVPENSIIFTKIQLSILRIHPK